MPEDREWFAAHLRELLDPFLLLTEAEISALYTHFQLLMRWNSKINLTSVRTPEQVVSRHYCESLFFASQLGFIPDGSTVADIGSGAGFPGVPIAVHRPGLSVALVESHQRKAVFLREATRHIAGISVQAVRSEDLPSKYDVLVSRAVSPDDIVALVSHRSTQIGLLIGRDDFERLRATADVAWEPPVPIPWSDRRVCVSGRSVL